MSALPSAATTLHSHLWIPGQTSGVVLHDVFLQDVEHFYERATPLDMSSIPAR